MKKLRRMFMVLLASIMTLSAVTLGLLADDVSPRDSDYFHVTVYEEDWRDIIAVRFFRDAEPLVVPLANMTLTVDGIEVDDIRDFTRNIAGWQTEMQVVMLDKLLPWQEMTLHVEILGQEWERTWLNTHFVSYTIFAEDWRESINIRFFQGVDPVLQLPIPLANMTMIVDGVEVENIRDFTLNIANWQTEAHTVFISKLRPWQEMTFRAEMFGQVWERTFINNMYEPEQTFWTTVYDEAWRETINIRFFTGDYPDGTALDVPLANITMIVDGIEVSNIRDFTVNIADWQTETSSVFIDKQLPWQELTLRVEMFGQVFERTWLNTFFLSTTVFAEDWRESINIRFFQGVDPVLPLTVSLDNITLIVDGVEVSDIRDFTRNIAGWQTETQIVMLDKLLPWQEMTFSVTAFGQTWERSWVNNMTQ